MDLSNIGNAINEHKSAIIIGLAVMLVFTIFSVARCSQVQTEKQEAAAAEEKVANQESDEETQALSRLSDEQRDKQTKYDQETQSLIQVLKANVWATEDKSHIILFTDRSYTERTSDGKAETHGYVIDAVDAEKETNADETVTNYTFAVESDLGTYFFKLMREDFSDQNIQYTLRSDRFGDPNNLYGPISVSDQMTVTGINQDLVSLVDNKQEDLENCIKEYCAQFKPQTKTINWAQVAQINWSENTVSIPFTFDNSTAQVTVVYNRSDHTFSVQKTV